MLLQLTNDLQSVAQPTQPQETVPLDDIYQFCPCTKFVDAYSTLARATIICIYHQIS